MTELVRRPEVVPGISTGWEMFQSLRDAGAITDSGLLLEPDSLTRDEALALAYWLGGAKRWTSWAVGDLIVLCERTWGQAFAYGDVARATGLTYHTVENLASVARRVPPSRRVDGLGISLHESVAKLEPVEQTRWLLEAANGGWTREELRERLKEADAPVPPEPPAAGEIGRAHV